MRNSKELVMSRALKFGVEIEVASGDRASIVNAIKAKGVSCRDLGYTHDVVSGWKIVSDGSLSYGGFEIVSPILYDMVQLQKVCEALVENGVTVDKKCGIHVHHDASGFQLENIKNIFRIYNKYGKAFDSIMPLSRRLSMNGFCKDIDAEWLAKVESCVDIEDMKWKLCNNDRRSNLRYRKVNFCSYLGYGTIEFRQHSGSIDFEKISSWVLITNMVMQQSLEGKKVKVVTDARRVKWMASDVHMMFDFYAEIGITATEVAEFIRGRRKALAPRERVAV